MFFFFFLTDCFGTFINLHCCVNYFSKVLVFMTRHQTNIVNRILQLNTIEIATQDINYTLNNKY